MITQKIMMVKDDGICIQPFTVPPCIGSTINRSARLRFIVFNRLIFPYLIYLYALDYESFKIPSEWKRRKFSQDDWSIYNINWSSFATVLRRV
jgi:hypothetical protein